MHYLYFFLLAHPLQLDGYLLVSPLELLLCELYLYELYLYKLQVVAEVLLEGVVVVLVSLLLVVSLLLLLLLDVLVHSLSSISTEPPLESCINFLPLNSSFITFRASFKIFGRGNESMFCLINSVILSTILSMI